MTPPAPAVSAVIAHLAAWTRRARARAALRWGLRGLAAGLAGGLLLALAARLWPLAPPTVLAAWASGVGLAALAGAALAAGLWPRSRLSEARAFDRQFGLAERMSMAVELAAQPGLAPEWLRAQQWTDAARSAAQVDLSRHLPLWNLPRRELLGTVVLGLGLAAALAAPNPQLDRLRQQQAAQQAMAAQAEQLDASIGRIENNPALSAGQKAVLTQPLQEALQALRQPGLGPEAALQALAQAQQGLRGQQDPQAEARALSLEQARSALSQNPLTRSAGQALAGGHLQQAAQALGQLDPASMTPAERQALADTLAEAARSTAAADPAAAGQLQAAADALRQGDAQAAQQALSQAAQSMAAAGQAAAQSQAAGQASDQVAAAQRAIAQAGQGQGAPGVQGTGPAQGQGQGQGQGQAAGDAAGASGGGAGRGEGTGAAQGGSAGGSAAQGNGPGDAGQRVYEAIYSPYRLGGSGGPDVNLPQQGNLPADGDVVGQGASDPGPAGQVTVPYNQFFPAYRDAAYAAVDQGRVPPELASVVRAYFSSLEP